MMFGRSSKLKLEFERDEALVLFELLARWIDDAPSPTPPAECFVCPAELHVLYQARDRLQALLSEPERADYLATLESARSRYADEVLGETLQG